VVRGSCNKTGRVELQATSSSSSIVAQHSSGASQSRQVSVIHTTCCWLGTCQREALARQTGRHSICGICDRRDGIAIDAGLIRAAYVAFVGLRLL
jgi:hypothetical protein